MCCRYGHFSGINRKVQMKYQPKGRPRGSSSDDGNCDQQQSQYQLPPTGVIRLSSRQLFCPFSIQIDWNVVSRIVVMLVDAIDTLSGDLYTYFLMRELKRSPDGASMAPTSITTMRDTTLQSIWIENGRNNCLHIILYYCLQVSKLP